MTLTALLVSSSIARGLVLLSDALSPAAEQPIILVPLPCFF